MKAYRENNKDKLNNQISFVEEVRSLEQSYKIDIINIEVNIK